MSLEMEVVQSLYSVNLWFSISLALVCFVFFGRISSLSYIFISFLYNLLRMDSFYMIPGWEENRKILHRFYSWVN